MKRKHKLIVTATFNSPLTERNARSTLDALLICGMQNNQNLRRTPITNFRVTLYSRAIAHYKSAINKLFT